MREDDVDPRADGAPPAERERRRPGAARRHEHPRAGRGVRVAPSLARHRDDLSGRDERLQPGEANRRADRRADGAARNRGGQAGAPGGGRAPRARRHLPDARRPVSARVLGRHAPARRDRDGPRVQAEGPARGRADDGARRDGAGAGARAARRPVDRPGALGRAGHARPSGRRADVHAGGRDVRGRDRRDRPGRPPLPRLAPPVHPAAVRGNARPLHARRRSLDTGRSSAPRPRARGLPVRAAVRPGLRALSDRPPGADRAR